MLMMICNKSKYILNKLVNIRIIVFSSPTFSKIKFLVTFPVYTRYIDR